MWQWTGQQRPDFAETPAADQESVWDYPRPPELQATDELVEVFLNGTRIAETRRALRVLETASPPTYYIPAEDVELGLLNPLPGQHSVCEWKGIASYFSCPDSDDAVAWRYDSPSSRFAAIDGCLSFYPGRIECRVNGERVQPQPGRFYGGWITSRIAGPFKGEAGTGHW